MSSVPTSGQEAQEGSEVETGMSLSLLISARADGSFGQSYQATCLPSFVSLVSMR